MSTTTFEKAVERPPVPARGWPRERVIGYILMGFWIAFGLALVSYLFFAWNPDLFDRYAGRYLKGLGVTLSLVVISVLAGAVLSIPVSYGRFSDNRLPSILAYAYVYCFRGTPLLVQVYFINYGLGSFRPQLEEIGLWWFFRESWYCAIFAFTLNTAAYQAEILRGAIESVPRGQWEGAKALGLHKLQVLRKIVLPQALIVALRPYGNEIILMVKGSAIVSIITIYDLMGEARNAYSRSYDFQTFIWAAILYLMIVEALRNMIEWAERRLTRHLTHLNN